MLKSQTNKEVGRTQSFHHGFHMFEFNNQHVPNMGCADPLAIHWMLCGVFQNHNLSCIFEQNLSKNNNNLFLFIRDIYH